MPKFVERDPSQLYLIPPDIRDWVPKDDLAHFVLEAVGEAFLQVLLMARELKLLKVGTVSVDGTKVRANASKRNSVRRDRAAALRERLHGEIADEVLVAVGTEDRRREHDLRPEDPEKPAREPRADWLKRMQEKMESDEGRARYRLRKQTVEPVFGIVKEAMGFRQ